MPGQRDQREAIAKMTPAERARVRGLLESEAYLWANAVAQQARRLREGGQPTAEFVADGRLLAYALRATLRAGEVLQLLLTTELEELQAALGRFRKACPDATNLRDAAEHFDDYLLDVGKLQKAKPELQYTQPNWERDPSTVRVGDLAIDVTLAEDAAAHLASVILVGKDHLDLLPEDG